MSSVFGTGHRYGAGDVAIYLLGVAGLAASLTLVFLGMRAVMDVGGFCAEGDPYQIQTHCPEGVPLVMIGGIFGLFLFGGVIAWKGSAIGGPYAGLVALAWPALFLSLGWNFLEYAINPPPGEGIVVGWLIPGVIFVIMGGAPLLALLPIGHTGPMGDVRQRMASGLAPRAFGSPRWTIQTSDSPPDSPTDDLVTKLERLASLHNSGDLSDDEYESAKRALLASEGAS